ncbi:MAG TPA: choice-of-anchor D domain-containing protein, partial [Anaeromyxobacter sp.]|nr:choice-of-anchor D domain-containing protein [Anaeromyxobacter sp.]
ASNDPASPLVNLAVSGTAAAEAVPSIAVDPVALDFGTVTVGSTASRTTQVRNTGNGALDVTGISLCDGTPAAFSVSPAAPFTVAPGESVTLTTTYAPTAAATDSGCFAIASSDPAHASQNVSLTGTGALAPVPSADADVDIEEFKVPKRVENPVGASITPLLHLRNLSQIDATASATLTGVLNGAKVYEETIPVTLAASEDGEVAFPPYVVAGARGTVRWTVTVADQDPDTDQAIARTMLGRPSRDAVASRDATDLADLEVLEDVEFQQRESSLLSADGASTSGGCSSGSGGAGFVTLLSLGLVAMRRRRSALRARH